jgi:hypothetical protein
LLQIDKKCRMASMLSGIFVCWRGGRFGLQGKRIACHPYPSKSGGLQTAVFRTGGLETAVSWTRRLSAAATGFKRSAYAKATA